MFHERWKIDYYFGVIPSSYFYKYYPKNFKYREIIFGLDPELYQNLKPFDERIKEKILNAGAMGNKKIKSRIANKLLNPGFSGWNLYKLRTLCNELPYVHHEGMKNENIHLQIIFQNIYHSIGQGLLHVQFILYRNIGKCLLRDV